MTPRHPGSGGSSEASSSKQKQEGDPFLSPATPAPSTPGSVRKQDKGRIDKGHPQKKKHFYQKTKASIYLCMIRMRCELSE